MPPKRDPEMHPHRAIENDEDAIMLDNDENKMLNRPFNIHNIQASKSP